jgi:hypothetical protein
LLGDEKYRREALAEIPSWTMRFALFPAGSQGNQPTGGAHIMIMGMSTYTFVHVVISLIGIFRDWWSC